MLSQLFRQSAGYVLTMELSDVLSINLHASAILFFLT